MNPKDRYARPRDAVSVNLQETYLERVPTYRGTVLMEHREADGSLLGAWEKENLVTLDGGILSAILFGSGATPTPPSQRGLVMLAVGTGATGPILNPDAPDERQRHLNAEIARKAFAATVFRTAGGAVSAVPTNVVDFTTAFGPGEAVGPLNEMGLLRPISTNPTVLNPVPSTFPTYNPAIDLTLYDVMCNLLNFSPISKTATSTLTFTWRLTF